MTLALDQSANSKAVAGSGKSVLLRTLLGLQVPARGNVAIEGVEVTTASGRELLKVKRRYGVTFQHGALFTSLTVAQNVRGVVMPA